MILTLDTREPWPHPWERFMPPGWSMIREGMETGDLAVAGLPHGVIVERKTVPDFLACVGRERARFERELKRGRYAARMVVIIEGSLPDVLAASRGITHISIVGTVAAWSVRYCPFLFAGSVNLAAELCWRALSAQVRDIHRQHEAMTPATATL
jgi:ERCC4-type nuclease